MSAVGDARKRLAEQKAATEPTGRGSEYTEVLEEVLSDHRLSHPNLRVAVYACICGIEFGPTTFDGRAYYAHLAAVLTDALVDARRAEVAERKGTFCEKCGAIVTHPSAHLKGGLNPGWRCPAGGVA